MATHLPLIIVGGGLAGSLAAVRMHERRPDIPVLLVEAGDSFGGNHVWSLFDSDIPAGTSDLIAALNPIFWPRHKVRFRERTREFQAGYNSIAAPSLDKLVRSRLPAEQYRLDSEVAQILPDGIVLIGGERIAARAVIDARGPQGEMHGLKLGWQKFVGIEFAAGAPEPDCAMVMDATTPQLDGFRFVYVLPMAPDRVLVEDTYYSDSPELGVEAIAERVRVLATERGLFGIELRRECGVLPILITGDPEQFWPKDDPVARLGLKGGFFHPTTGYSIGLALRLAEDLSTLPGKLMAPQLAAWSRAKFICHWRNTRFFRLLNQMLFRAASPDRRDLVFEHFYRLPPERIARFYAAELTLVDQARILSGKPPVAIGAALRALLQR